MKEKKVFLKEGFFIALKFLAPKLALILLVVLYAIAGGYIFKHLESTNEKQECFEKMGKYQPLENETIEQMWNIISNYKDPGDGDSAIEAFHKQLSAFRDNVLTISYDGTNCSDLDQANGTLMKWSLSGSIFFSTTVFTTVGYGNIAPKTMWGRLVCIAYAILGIPLMLLMLANIGEIMANIFRYTYLNMCCCGILNWSQSADLYVENDEEDDFDKISVPIIVTLFLIGSYVFLGSVLFAVWIELSWMDAAYFSFITFSTIGFGDIVPGTNLKDTNAQLQMFGTALYMVSGMAILSMAFNLMQEEVADKLNWLGNQVKSLQKSNRIKNE